MRPSPGSTFALPIAALSIAALLMAGCATYAFASPPPSGPSRDEVPMIAGRVAATEGNVQIWRTEEDGQGEWDAAQINDVVTVSTALATSNSSRAEVRVGPHALRLDALSRGSFSQLDFDAKVFALAGGAANLRLAAAAQGERLGVTAGGVNVELGAPGRYRIDAIDGEPLRITVFEGQALARFGANSIGVSSGQALVLTQSSINYATATATALDDWALARDQRLSRLAVSPLVSPYMTGYEELAAHGNWVGDASYGTVWVPNAVPVGWAPYRHGRWRWVAPWGWSWVDAAPWGYAPFHYGRWVTVGGRWCWWPGAYVARPVWAPALVGFVATGGSATRVTIGVGAPVVGWYPLAPWNPYRPSYTVNNTYVTVINQTIINQPPRGVPPSVNQGPGATMVPGPRFRDPVNKVVLLNQPPLAELQPSAPPPRPLARTAAVSDSPYVFGPHDRPKPASAPALSSTSPSIAAPPGSGAKPSPGQFAQGGSKFNLAAQPPLPGQNPTPLAQPPGLRTGPAEPAPAAPTVPPRRDAPPPTPRANLPLDQLPPGQPRPIAPAEPAVSPPGTLPRPVTTAPPQGRPQPSVPPPRPTPRLVGPAQPQPAAIAPVQANPRPAAAPVAAPPQVQPAPRPGSQSKQDQLKAAAEADAVRAPKPDVPRTKSQVP